ncbi:hypothetical protein [Cohnella silvisoli]|uniref:Uncharacterized protein n=1 Tax=Cohnella silvisoli TaxID=2873699 RepID=A0ABV1KLY6_9BACL|nr:hypothetical protein [Cohnella silvisoli]MCD9020568.1 hypothetical protein [Cohnella silvisoli]
MGGHIYRLKIVEVIEDGLTPRGNQKFSFILNAGEKVGTKGETLIKIVLSNDGGMLSAYPTK